MTKKERWKAIKKLYPLAEAGNIEALKQFMGIMKRNYKVSTCAEPGCGQPTQGTNCHIHRSALLSMRKALLPLALLIFGMSCYAASPIATVTLTWIPGDNPTGTQHLILGGLSSGTYTFTNAVPYSQTTCTISNLLAGTKYYFVVQETDGVDVSPFSNECMVKTKLNPPKYLSGSAP